MPTLVLTDLDDAIVDRLRWLASSHQRSIEAEAASILADSLPREMRSDRAKIAASIAAMTPKDVVQTDSVLVLREDRSRDDLDE